MNYKYPLCKDNLNKSDIQHICDWLSQEETPQLSMGKEVRKAEEMLAKWVGRKYAVLVNSGSSANLLAAWALRCSKMLKNGKVCVCGVGWATTISPFMQLKGFDTPIMIDASIKNFAMDLDILEKKCEEEDPGLVVIVQPLGVLIDKDRLLRLKEKYNFVLMEDACAAVSSSYADGVKAGNIGNISTWSTFFGHQLTAAGAVEGGVVFCDNIDLYNLLIMAREHGFIKNLPENERQDIIKKYEIEKLYEKFSFIIPGFNLRPIEMLGVSLQRKILELDDIAEKRYKNHKLYQKHLSDLADDGTLIFQDIQDNKVSSISFAILLGKDIDHVSVARANVVEALEKNSIETRIYSAGNLGQSVFWKNFSGDKNGFRGPIAERIHKNGMFLPNYISLTEEDIIFICNVIKGAVYNK